MSISSNDNRTQASDQTDKRFQAIIEHSSDIVALVNSEGNVTYVSSSITNSLGYSPHEFIGKNALVIIHPDDLSRMQALLGSIFQTPGQKLTAEYRLLCKDGSWKWFEASATNLLDDPVVGAVVGNFHDISRRKSMEEELFYAHQQLDVIFKHIVDGILVQNSRGEIVYANQAAADLLDYPSVSILTHAPHLEYAEKFEFFDEQGQPLSVQHLPGRQVLVGNAQSVEIVLKSIHKKTRHLRWMIVKANSITEPHYNNRLIMTVMHDITQRKEMDLRKDEFISMASHELKTPITSLKGFVQILLRRFRKKQDDETVRFLNRIDTQVNKLTRLVNDLLDISKMSTGVINYQDEDFAFDVLLGEVVESVQQITASHRLFLEGLTSVTLKGDKERLGQVIINLLTNAIKYSPLAHHVLVCMEVGGESVTVRVQDFGIGIDPVHQEKICERFYRVPGSEEETYSGLGVGLYLASEIIKHHQGQIWVESVKGEGSTFSFTLPLHGV